MLGKVALLTEGLFQLPFTSVLQHIRGAVYQRQKQMYLWGLRDLGDACVGIPIFFLNIPS